MHYFFLFLLVLSLFFLAYQDFKQRAISWWVLPLILLFYFFCYQSYGSEEIIDFFYNFSFLCINLLLVTIYFSLKSRKLISIIDSYLGLGDILFLILCTIMFSLVNFILFLLVSYLITLLVWGIYFLKNSKASKEIPLAGVLSVLLIFLIVFEEFAAVNVLRTTDWLDYFLF